MCQEAGCHDGRISTRGARARGAARHDYRMLSDLRYAIRALRRSPALSAMAMVSLALGIGGSVTVYSIVREMILSDISATRLDRLARVDGSLTYAQYRTLRPIAGFQDLAFDTGLHDAIWNNGDRAEVIWAMDTSPNFFEVLGIHAAAGRLYGQSDEGAPIAVVTDGFWRKRLHADSRAIGRALTINNRLYTLAGVLPHDYRSILGHGVSPEIYAPARLDSQQGCHPFGRLRDGTTREQARDFLAAAATSIGGPDFARRVASIRPMGGITAFAAGQGDDRRVFLFFAMLFGAAGMMALIACSNVAGLLLARRIERRKELAIRQALGANRWQLARPLLAEAAVLVTAGSALGLALDAWLRGRLSALRWPTAYNIPIEFHFQNDRGLLLYALLTAAAAMAVCSLGTVSDRSIGATVKGGRGARNLRNGFVALQVVLSMVLLILGGLFTRSFLHIARGDLGFDAVHTAIAAVHPPPQRYRAEDDWTWRSRLIASVQRVPGVVAVTSTGMLPLMGEMPEAPLRREGEPVTAARDIYFVPVGERYFETLGIRMLRGRDFEIADRDRKPTPAIVNRTLARRFFGDADPIGAMLLRGRGREDAIQIVGVAADCKLRTLGEAPQPAFYTPDFNGQLLVRVAGDPARWTEPLRAALRSADTVSALDVRPLADAVNGAQFPLRIAATMAGSLSGVGLVLALVGVYGSVSSSVSRRTREMGIRAALGATRGRIVWTALREGAALMTAGAAVGLVLAIAAVRPLADLVPDGVDAWDPRMFAATAALLAATGLTAALIPARRAANCDPAVVLREE